MLALKTILTIRGKYLTGLPARLRNHDMLELFDDRYTSVERYLSPQSTATVTILPLPTFLATSREAATLAPVDEPENIPSSLASLLAISCASSVETVRISSYSSFADEIGYSKKRM